MHVAVGHELLALARQASATSLVVVGTGKNVGKTVAMRAVYQAALANKLFPGLTSIGRDGEAIDVGDAQSKPRLFLRAGTIVATAREVLPATPASEVLELSRLATAAGPLVYVRVRGDAYYELIGPPTASGLREAIGGLGRHSSYTIVDGAIDRVAALAGGGDAVVVACGASTASTPDEAIDEVRALVTRLCVPEYDGASEAVAIEGALTPSKASELLRSRESRVVLVQDPTQIALTGRAALTALAGLTIRCMRAIRVVGVTVASIGRSNHFEPRDFANAVAEATGLPTFDVYTSERAA
jgi:hypothetical protein